MTEYTPDHWVLIKLPEDRGYKVLGGWSGGYLYGDSWRLNSGIKSTEEHDDYYLFYGYSGSVYKCFKNREGARHAISGILMQLKEGGAEVVPYTGGIKWK